MSCIETGQFYRASRGVRSQCPDCPGDLAVLRVMGGRAGTEYWALRCERCGSIHLDIIDPPAPSPKHDGAPAA